MIHAHRLVYYRASAQQAIREWWAKTTTTLPRTLINCLGHGSSEVDMIRLPGL